MAVYTTVISIYESIILSVHLCILIQRSRKIISIVCISFIPKLVLKRSYKVPKLIIFTLFAPKKCKMGIVNMVLYGAEIRPSRILDKFFLAHSFKRSLNMWRSHNVTFSFKNPIFLICISFCLKSDLIKILDECQHIQKQIFHDMNFDHYFGFCENISWFFLFFYFFYLMITLITFFWTTFVFVLVITRGLQYFVWKLVQKSILSANWLD